MLNKNLFNRMANWAVENSDPNKRQMPGQVTQPKISVHKKGYGGFYTKAAQDQKREKDIYEEEERKRKEREKAARKKKRPLGL